MQHQPISGKVLNISPEVSVGKGKTKREGKKKGERIGKERERRGKGKKERKKRERKEIPMQLLHSHQPISGKVLNISPEVPKEKFPNMPSTNSLQLHKKNEKRKKEKGREKINGIVGFSIFDVRFSILDFRLSTSIFGYRFSVFDLIFDFRFSILEFRYSTFNAIFDRFLFLI